MKLGPHDLAHASASLEKQLGSVGVGKQWR